MVRKSRPRKRVHAILLVFDGSAFQKWEEFMQTSGVGDEVIGIEDEGFETWKTMSKEVSSKHWIATKAP